MKVGLQPVLAALLCGLVVLGPATEGVEGRNQEEGGCRKRRIVHTIKSANCIPRRLLSYACQGWCSSYTQISSTLEFKRHCKCCQEMGERTARVRVRCRDPKKGGGGLKLYTMLLKIPHSCMCRPCSQEDRAVEPLELAAVQVEKRTT